MKMVDATRTLFGSARKRIRELSSSTVSHDSFDDGVLEDFEERAAHFREVIEDAPEVHPHVPLPERDDFEDEADYVKAQEEAVEAQNKADAVAGNYSGWQHDVKDVFRAYHTWDEPHVKDRSEVKPSRELGRQLMQRLTLADSFADGRPYTRHSDVESALATMAFSERLRTELETTLAEHVAKSEEASEQEDRLDNMEQALEDLRQQAKDQYDANGQVDPQLAEQVKQAVQEKRQAQAGLAATAQAISELPTAAIAEAVDEAADDAAEEAEMAAGIPGVGPGMDSRITPEQAFALATRWRENETLREIAKLIGKMRRDMRFARAKRLQGGREEVVDFELGNDPALILPHELAMAAHPVLKADFVRRFVERSLVQYEMVGEDDAGLGPVVIVCDGSGSMGADLGGSTRNEWARALSLATLSIVHEEKRDFAFVEYSSSGSVQSWFFPAKEPVDAENVADMAAHFFCGGTDTVMGLTEAVGIIHSVPQFKAADVLLISDGDDRWSSGAEERVNTMRELGVRIQGIAVASGITQYLREACEVVTPIYNMTDSEGATAAVANTLNP